MHVTAVRPPHDSGSFLAGAQFSDAFSIAVPNGAMTARDAAERMFSRTPRWVAMLLQLRDRVVAPFGLKTSQSARQADVEKVGLFPILGETPLQLVAGFDDRHLDFRIVIDVAPDPGGQRVTATTVVLTHNLLGRVYLASIAPFHRLVMRAMLGQVRPRLEASAQYE